MDISLHDFLSFLNPPLWPGLLSIKPIRNLYSLFAVWSRLANYFCRATQWKMLPGQMAGNLKETVDQWVKSVHALVRHETVPLARLSLVHWRCGIVQVKGDVARAYFHIYMVEQNY